MEKHTEINSLGISSSGCNLTAQIHRGRLPTISYEIYYIMSTITMENSH